MKKNIFSLISLTIPLLASGCSRPPVGDSESPIHKYGLTEAVLYRPVVTSAIDIANAILQDDTGFKLAPGWAAPTVGNKVRVFLVREFNLAKTDMVFIPQGEPFVIINERLLIRFLESKVRESLYPSILALMLLHEVGHIVHGESGSYIGPNEFSLTDLETARVPDTAQKNRELAADSFAAYQVRDAMKDGEHPLRFSSALKVSSALVTYQFNISTGRLIDHFGDLSGIPFLDEGYTHPNYELRLLLLSNLISPSEGSLKLVKDFLEQRKAAVAKRSKDQEGRPRIIWRDKEK